jgi:hypothetical protein
VPEPEQPRVSRKALKYIGVGPTVGGVPETDLTAQQATDWLTDAQYAEVLANKSHKEASQKDAAAIDKAALWARTPAHKRAALDLDAPAHNARNIVHPATTTPEPDTDAPAPPADDTKEGKE